MARKASFLGVVLAVFAWAPGAALAQADHQHAPGTPAHDHSGPIVSCTDLAAPPWTGLPAGDRQHVDALREAVAGLTTPEAATAAGFRPALGDIPGMGVHYVNRERGQNGVRPGEPDHLLFSEVDGEMTLVGAAYAFIDAPVTDEPIPFESDLASWHDHPQFAPEGQTLHMLHVWFVPSSNGPFAGLNFWLPFESAGVTPPSACWMADAEIGSMIQTVSFALARTGELERSITGDTSASAPAELSAERRAILADLDAAAGAQNLNGWIDAAERFLADLTPAERRRTEMMLRVLMNAQMSSTEREAAEAN